MTWMWTILAGILLIVWVLTLVDILRRHYPGKTTAGYIALMLILPIIGTLIYWAVRKPTAAETEAAYQAQMDVHDRSASAPINRAGF
jgi:amino acid transporter